jgi:hypothetical protein
MVEGGGVVLLNPIPIKSHRLPFLSVQVEEYWLPPGVSLIGGGQVGILKFTPLLATVATVTITLPLVAPTGTVTVMLVALQLVTDATVPLKVTVLVPWVAPKFCPVIVTDVPGKPENGDSLRMPGAGGGGSIGGAGGVGVLPN